MAAVKERCRDFCKVRGVLLAMGALILTQCATPPPAAAVQGRESTLRQMGYVPLRLDKVSRDVRFSRKFGVNGMPMRLLIDSGANSTDIDGTLADHAGVKRSKSISVISRGALGRPVRSGYGRGTLRAGPVEASNFPFTLSPSDGRKTATSRYAGQLGLDGLNGLSGLVDVPRASLWVPGPNSAQARSGNNRPLGEVKNLGTKVLHLKRAGNLPHLLLTGMVNGRRTTWVVDTGAEVTVMGAESFKQFGLPSYKTDSNIIDASGDKVGIRMAELQNVYFDGVLVKRFHIAVAPMKAVREVFRDSSGRPVDGIIGMDFLTKGNALLDTKSRLLYLGGS